MEDVISSKTNILFRARTVEPCVIRLPNGNVRVTGDAARFPDLCPRCERSPAKTEIKLRLTKPRVFKADSADTPAQTDFNWSSTKARRIKSSNRVIKIPFCRQCGWSLKVAQNLPVIFGCLAMGYLGPLIERSHPRQFPWFSSGIAVVTGAVAAGLVDAVLRYLPNLIIDPGVKVVAVTKDSAELAFNDQMYAEKFVLLNR